MIGTLASPWWVPLLWIVVLGHITNLCVTLYLHRSATHEGVKFAHPSSTSCGCGSGSRRA